MNTTTLALGPDDNIDNLLGLLRRISEHLQEAAKMLARLVHADPQTIDKIQEKAPEVPRGFLVNLLRVGEGSMHPKLFLASGQAYNRLRMLPYTVQEQVIEEGAVEVVIGADVVRVALAEMKPEHISQVFASGGLRSVDDQRAWLKREALAANKPVSREEAFPWLVKRDKVQILRPVDLTKKDVLRILQELEA
jgi:hypothetical protein